MLVKQLSVFMENKPGRLANLCCTLGENNIDFVTLSIADTKEYGIVRFIARDTDKAFRILKEKGFAVEITELIGIEVPDVPNALGNVVKMIEKADINIDYLYSFTITSFKSAKILLKVSDKDKTIELLNKNNIKLLTETNI